MSYSILYTDYFERELKRLTKKYNSFKDEFSAFADTLKENPFQCTSLGHSFYKIRLSISSQKKENQGEQELLLIFISTKLLYI
jgi:hypothetical protein